MSDAASRAIDALLARALEEDRPKSDLTTEAVLPGADGAVLVVAIARAKASGVVAGLAYARRLVEIAGGSLAAEALLADGGRVTAGAEVLRVTGPASEVLRVERPLLNLLQHLSGVATLTARFADAVRGTGVRVCDTRKTLPALREMERHAVRAGGGEHHRESLSAAVLVKENHVRALSRAHPEVADPFREAVRRAVLLRDESDAGIRVGIEAESVDEALAAAEAGADLVLLDDFAPDALRDAVRRLRAIARPRPLLIEASGGVTLETVRAIAETGVDRISIGALTHSAKALDLSMKIEKTGPAAP